MKQNLDKKTEPSPNTERKYISSISYKFRKKRPKNITTLNSRFNSRLRLCLETEQSVAFEIKNKILHRKVDQETIRGDMGSFKQCRKITFYANNCFFDFHIFPSYSNFDFKF